MLTRTNAATSTRANALSSPTAQPPSLPFSPPPAVAQVDLCVHVRAPSFFRADEQPLALRLAQGDGSVTVPKNLEHLCQGLGLDARTHALSASEALAQRRAAKLLDALAEHDIARERVHASWQGFGETASVELSFVEHGGASLPSTGLQRLPVFGAVQQT